jgi:hypothetical protein
MVPKIWGDKVVHALFYFEFKPNTSLLINPKKGNKCCTDGDDDDDVHEMMKEEPRPATLHCKSSTEQ